MMPVSHRIALTGMLVLVLAAVGVHWLRGHVRLAWNETESLPQSVFLVLLGTQPDRGDYVLFDPPQAVNSHYPFVKQVAGLPGDAIRVEGRAVWVDGRPVGVAKTMSRRGELLHPIAPGIIPPGFIFVHANHRDSYDSRYQSLGLVPDARVIGRAVPLF
ncbi:conjugal transfer protein TraF [Iodidimonas gelatinilytica]|uniref:Signal peptidase I n=1 Tax=Iodidimonas gelatinilytica TaxID=1236966 RepID=A0A5A7MWH7_9PROT|nr:conjugative transfer signal peptidase TraF [Iodidimonas gelatinilytica]GEQ99205.1 conjugal transfer protein TraF [Iodidimonas gelatinilytica]